jgi:DNA-directed RNA polymerase subunit M/transcription elongation factor TFIIS
MSDKLQFYTNSADVAPGKGTGESLVSSAETYSGLRKIKHWRRILSEKSEGYEEILKLTASAELWQGVPKKPSIRREDLESQRTKLLEMKPKDTQQRIIQSAAEMSQSTKKPRTKKSAVAPLGGEEAASEHAVSNIPEGAIAMDPPVAHRAEAAGSQALPSENLSVRDQDEHEHEESSSIKFCPVCSYYLYLQMDFDTSASQSSINVRLCRNCGYKEEDKKGGLVSEILIKERSAEGYKILLNEFTTRDYRLPHIRGSLKCPSAICDTNTKGVESDIIYLKDDMVNLTYLYICSHCNTQWRSRR